jgi:DNA-binding MarR family transcriptional regulator
MTKSKEIFTLRSYCVEDSVGYLLARARTKLVKSVDCQLSQYDITHAQGSILMMVSSGKCITAADLARELYIDSASMTRMIDRLEKRGLIERMPRGDDRRVINLRLTEDGQALADQLPGVYTSVLNRNFVDFSVDEVSTLKILLRKLLDTETAAAEAVGKKPR